MPETALSPFYRAGQEPEAGNKRETYDLCRNRCLRAM
jgi:hypothetical protein